MGGERTGLERLRLEVDRIDGQIVELLAARMQVVADIAATKRAADDRGPVIRPAREAQLLRRLVEQARGKLPAVIVKLGFITDDQVTQFIARRQNLRIAELDKVVLPQNLIKKVPRELIEKHTCIPIAFRDGMLTLAVADRRMRVTEVVLRPAIEIAPGGDVAKARELVDAAHRACFIANSVSCAVLVDASVAAAAVP